MIYRLFCGIVSVRNMSNPNFGFTSINEYRKSQVLRRIGEEIVADRLYVATFSLLANSANLEAIRLPFTVKEVTSRQTGKVAVSAALFDINARSRVNIEATFTDGYWQRPYENGLSLRDRDGIKLLPTESYLRIDNGTLEENYEYYQVLEIPVDQLVSV